MASILPQNDSLMEQYISAVRTFMRDYQEVNRLTKGEESNDRMLAWCIMDALNQINITVPVTNWSLAQVPPFLLVRGAVITALESVGLLKSRNYLQFQDSMGTISRENPQLIQSWIQLFRGSYDQKLSDFKIYRNVMGALGGGASSEYNWINNGYYGLY